MGNNNFDLIEEKSHILLKEKSKDIRVLSFLSFVYLRKEKWGAFADVFTGLSHLVQQNYDALFPTRPHAKQMAFKWLAEPRYTESLNIKKPKETEHEHIKRLIESLRNLKSVLDTKFPDGSPFPSKLLSTAQTWEKYIKPKSEVTAVSKPAPADSSNYNAAKPEQAGTVPMENPKEAQTNGRKIAMFLIEKEPEKPMGYRLIRSLRWDLIEKAPPSENGKTRIEPPTTERKTFIQSLVAKGDWEKALFTVEKEFSSGPTHYWLDLQRISAKACKELGDSYSRVYDVICYETALLLKRIPSIPELSFSDGTTFCDNATKDWIDSDISAILSSSEKLITKHDKLIDDPLNEEKKMINALVSKGKTEEAVEILHNKINESVYERINFKRSLLLCNTLISAKRSDIALAILESLHEKIISNNLDKWEPDLAVETWSLLIKTYRIVGSTKPQNIQIAMKEKQNIILNRISCIDPKSALKINT